MTNTPPVVASTEITLVSMKHGGGWVVGESGIGAGPPLMWMTVASANTTTHANLDWMPEPVTNPSVIVGFGPGSDPRANAVL